MASVDFKKLHSPSELKRILRHCDQTMRLNDGHRNKDIQKDLTHLNTQLSNRDYKQVCKLYEKMIAELDKLPGANKRPDRVTAFALETPAPLTIRDDDRPRWFENVYTLICEQYDYRNVLQYYVHYDEVHEYLNAENGSQRISRAHSHCLIIPEHDGRLNGRWFSSRANMIKLNNAIQAMTFADFGIEFMNGTKKGSNERIGHLKRLSEARKYEQLISEKQRTLDDLSLGIDHFDEIFKLGLERYKELYPEAVVDYGKIKEEIVGKVEQP